MCSILECFVTFVITMKKNVILIMNVNQIKTRLKSAEHILTEKRQAKSEVWKSFHKESDAATKEKNDAVH
jgi:hypothetical protein